MLKEQSEKYGVTYWAYCLMSNHVHLIAVPQRTESLARAIGEAHRRYTRMINFREKWRGYLWQGRLSSFPLDTAYLYNAVRYVERNPVRARIVRRSEDYQWSIAMAHVKKEKDPLISDFYPSREIKDWGQCLDGKDDQDQLRIIRKHIETGRPLGDETFIEKMEKKLGVILKKKKPGPKPKR